MCDQIRRKLLNDKLAQLLGCVALVEDAWGYSERRAQLEAIEDRIISICEEVNGFTDAP